MICPGIRIATTATSACIHVGTLSQSASILHRLLVSGFRLMTMIYAEVAFRTGLNFQTFSNATQMGKMVSPQALHKN
jgi:hypothetical protein